ncbi:hypothetical protein Back11_34430 [Paenibacillus baekrokdamisoli]|uniref:Uncharacterized protein n=1 Tax=Paenibacillus baekrokdamisoli TaxID=1712516 RepID=A0A3G9JDN0_9BACL|nr:hypothetical protein [Paenibacillus baekrokdamisoli]BBH22098.1 hypothetical protein Back11_34430 [Paenibacillus baekrokdamisoli]
MNPHNKELSSIIVTRKTPEWKEKNESKLPLHGNLGENGGGIYPYRAWQDEELVVVSFRLNTDFDADTDHLDWE